MTSKNLPEGDAAFRRTDKLWLKDRFSSPIFNGCAVIQILAQLVECLADLATQLVGQHFMAEINGCTCCIEIKGKLCAVSWAICKGLCIIPGQGYKIRGVYL